MKIKIQKENKTIEINEFNKTLKELLDELNINFEEVIVAKKIENEMQIITEDEILNSNDYIEILSVISGG
jgi:sulfur carrier protein ThiS